MSSKQILFLILTVTIHIQTCTGASLVKTKQPNGEIWLQQLGTNLTPTDATQYNNITLGQIMSIEFDFIFNGRNNPPPQTQQNPRAGYEENFFRIGHTSNSKDDQKSSYPAMFLTNSGIGDKLDIKVCTGNSCPGSTDGILYNYGILTIGVTHHIKIAFDNTNVQVDITNGGKTPFTKSWTRQQTPTDKLGNTVPVWFLSDTYYSTPYNPGNATFNNIIIKSNIFTFAPTIAPFISPTKYPSKIPTINPTLFPSETPTKIPTNNPTLLPTVSTASPTIYKGPPTTGTPTLIPTQTPTNKPTISPTNNPSNKPTMVPSINPTTVPTISPTLDPTENPSRTPSVNPSEKPSVSPTNKPTETPSNEPTETPTYIISTNPTPSPTDYRIYGPNYKKPVVVKSNGMDVFSGNMKWFWGAISIVSVSLCWMVGVVVFCMKRLRYHQNQQQEEYVD